MPVLLTMAVLATVIMIVLVIMLPPAALAAMPFALMVWLAPAMAIIVAAMGHDMIIVAVFHTCRTGGRYQPGLMSIHKSGLS